jgi:hypothetical protein
MHQIYIVHDLEFFMYPVKLFNVRKAIEQDHHQMESITELVVHLLKIYTAKDNTYDFVTN